MITQNNNQIPIATNNLSEFQVVKKELDKHGYQYLDIVIINSFYVNNTILLTVKVHPHGRLKPDYKKIEDFPYRVLAIKKENNFLKEIGYCLEVNHAWVKMEQAERDLNNNKIL